MKLFKFEAKYLEAYNTITVQQVIYFDESVKGLKFLSQARFLEHSWYTYYFIIRNTL